MAWIFFFIASLIIWTTLAVFKRLKRMQRNVSEGRSALDGLIKKRDELAQTLAERPSERVEEDLQAVLNRIAFTSQSFNDTVLLYNLAQKEFPGRLFASSFGHQSQPL
ncbi:MAG: hypothetical protein KR126chlam2_00266 [Chlamydiae bacterium]|nr:hypothetical protein [Chlamydiota bacterium]